jgi:hypothetical protein
VKNFLKERLATFAWGIMAGATAHAIATHSSANWLTALAAINSTVSVVVLVGSVIDLFFYKRRSHRQFAQFLEKQKKMMDEIHDMERSNFARLLNRPIRRDDLSLRN